MTADGRELQDWMTANHAVLLRVARLYSRTEPEDLVQSTMARAWRKRATYDSSRGSPMTWLCAILRTQAVEISRYRAHVELRTSLDIAAPASDLDARLDIRKAVLHLADRQREVVLLFYYADLPLATISEMLGTTVGTVKSTLFDARKRLSKELETYDHQR